jgi:hypothetical protein
MKNISIIIQGASSLICSSLMHYIGVENIHENIGAIINTQLWDDVIDAIDDNLKHVTFPPQI